MRFAVDTGGTFTDLLVEDDSGELRLYKTLTRPEEPVDGVLDVLENAADDFGLSRDELLARGRSLTYGTTHAINAILQKTTARTAFLTTAGHPDVLVFREGGRARPFDFSVSYPAPFVPRSLTFEIHERVNASGEVVQGLDEAAALDTIDRLASAGVEAVGVCFLWSIRNPAHELRIGELLDMHLPDVPYTLSHRLNPAPREYRRASSTCIDAALKPIMQAHLDHVEQRLGAAGFKGQLFVVTSTGGTLAVPAVREAPILTLGSGPAMAPVAGRHFAKVDAQSDTAVVADSGGTSYDVSLVRRGRLPWTRETWIGQAYSGHITGFPSVEVKSIGAGGGSVAWVDEAGLLHVGPNSAGARPGPACYDQGGTRATVTDAALVLGYLDADYFLGGALRLNAGAAAKALDRDVAKVLGVPTRTAAAAVLELVTAQMVRAIEEITLQQGVDPQNAVLVGGGGAAGLNAVAIARRLGSPRVVIPEVGAALSAAGALLSDVTADFAASFPTTSEAFDFTGVNRVLRELRCSCRSFLDTNRELGAGALIELACEARYPRQIWELEVPLPRPAFGDAGDVEDLRRDFHAEHQELFAISDPGSEIEIVSWRARARCINPRGSALGRLRARGDARPRTSLREVAFGIERAPVRATVVVLDELDAGNVVSGPAIVESPVTTVVIPPRASAERTAAGSLWITPWIDVHEKVTAVEAAAS